MNVLSFDVESNGLHGAAFAVAGVLMNTKGESVSEFVTRCPLPDPVDPWVTDNVLGPMADIAENAVDAYAMRQNFWNWYLESKSKADIIVAANPYPVEARFLIACQADDMSTRSFEHPFPFYDLSSMLLGNGYASPTARKVFLDHVLSELPGQAHNPLWDAKATALVALKIINQKHHSANPQHAK